MKNWKKTWIAVIVAVVAFAATAGIVEWQYRGVKWIDVPPLRR